MTGLTATELAAVTGFLTTQGVAPAGPLTSTRIAAGRSNLTVQLDDGVRRWVLRMPPRAGRTPSAHDVAREYRIIAALAGSDVPVPPATALCEDLSVIGCPFAVAEYVEGRTIQSRSDLDTLDDATLAAVVDRLVAVLAALHRVDHDAVGLAGLGRSGSYAERQIRRWSRQWELVAGDDPATRRDAEELSRRLARGVPPQQATGIVHGDFRIDNTLLVLDDAPAVAAVVDWELSTIGDPVADVATMCAYRHPAFDLIVGSPGAWTSPRLPGDDGLAAAYAAAGGVPLTSWDFHLALAHFKIAVIAAGIDHRHRVGAASGPGFDTAGAAVGPYLAAGLDLLGGHS
ncbi:phosphotransferase family protein [Dactylosporangium sp. NPDC000555]|uniref:phosphotransferase family protein n=1 Tax=Dactylosporangium sp. NPDC000555 TaxID=3154260 RepID=UPI003324061C